MCALLFGKAPARARRHWDQIEAIETGSVTFALKPSY
jgi:hypothetical protein